MLIGLPVIRVFAALAIRVKNGPRPAYFCGSVTRIVKNRWPDDLVDLQSDDFVPADAAGGHPARVVDDSFAIDDQAGPLVKELDARIDGTECEKGAG